MAGRWVAALCLMALLLPLSAAAQPASRASPRVESLLAVKGMKRVPVADDLGRLGMRVRTAEESLAELL